jgi:hypothetical protein
VDLRTVQQWLGHEDMECAPSSRHEAKPQERRKAKFLPIKRGPGFSVLRAPLDHGFVVEACWNN